MINFGIPFFSLFRLFQPCSRSIPAGFLSYGGALLGFISLLQLHAGELSREFPGDPLEIGPLFHEFSLTIEPGWRREVLGPVYYFQQRDEETMWALPPFFSRTQDPATNFTEMDFLYPIFTYDRFGAQYRFHLLQLMAFAGGEDQDDLIRRRFTLFPIYFQQRSPVPEFNYTAVFPIYGRLENRLFRDEIRFILFPLYVQTRGGATVTDNYLFPIFHFRSGPGLRGWQVWPLVGHEVKEITSRINMIDEEELVPGHERLFVLWPFFHKNHLGIGAENPRRQLVFLPFFSVQRSPQRDTTTAPWPLGLTYTHDREREYREWGAPWPFIVFARGEGKTVNRIWPLFSQARSPRLQSDFYLWPVYRYQRMTAETLDRERTRILFFLYSNIVERNTERNTAFNRKELWPLFTSRRDHAGNERLQILAPLEPLLPNNKSIERNYSPLWSVWRSERNQREGTASQSLLWNFYRRETAPESRKCSLLFGLFRYQSGPDGRKWRLFYIPFGNGNRVPGVWDENEQSSADGYAPEGELCFKILAK